MLAPYIEHADGTVTLWAVTSTTDTNAADTDVGADRNEVVEITDVVAATSASQITNESSRVVAPRLWPGVPRHSLHRPPRLPAADGLLTRPQCPDEQQRQCHFAEGLSQRNPWY